MKNKANGSINTDFVVTDRIRQLAKEKGWPNPDSEVEAFIDYHKAGGWRLKNGLTIVDREAAFRTWLRNAAKFRPRVNPPITPPPPIKLDKERPQEIAKVRNLLSGLVEQFDVRKSKG